MQGKRMYRNTGRHVIGGVCSGLGEYLGVDPVIMRIIFVLLAFVGGGGVLIYLILWIVIPEIPAQHYYQNAQNAQNPNNPYDPNMEDSSTEGENTPPYENNSESQPYQSSMPIEENEEGVGKGGLIGGVILIGIGVLFLIDQYIPRIYFEDFWPLLLIIGGAALLVNYYNKNKE